MSFWSTLKDIGSVALAPVSGGASLLGLDPSVGHKIPLIGGFFDDPAAEEKQRMLHQMAIAYQAQRPELAQSQTNALNQSLQAYAPSNEMLGKMYGQGAMADLGALGQNPMTPGFMNPGVGMTASLQSEIDRLPRKPTTPKPAGGV
jgi:hypothetical protein